MTTIEARYKQALNTDLKGLAKNTARKFSFMLKSLAIEHAHGSLYDLALDEFVVERETFANKFFGTTMWDNFTLDNAKDGIHLRIDMVLMNVSMSKNIIKTSIQGMPGTVKEYVNSGDYIINIKGALFGQNNEYPEDAVMDLIELCERSKNIRVESHYLQLFNINDIVIENYKFEAKEGLGNAQFFEINAISDIEQELIFSENKQTLPLVMI
jgi:hypothetical protein